MSKVSNAIKQQLTRFGLRRSEWLPKELFEDDVFLVAYPKSGSTWLRFQLANLIHEGAEEVDFHNYHHHMPVVGSPEEKALLHGPRILSTHAPCSPQYKKVIYQVRDGRDVYVSYYHHLKRFLPEGMTFGQFLTDWKHYPGRWSDHVTDWLDGYPSEQLLVVQYESMLREPIAELRRIAEFVGIESDEAMLKDAVERSSFSKMKKSESDKGRYNTADGPKEFVRKGVAGDWTNTFTDTDLQVFDELEGAAMRRLGYQPE